MISVYMPDIGDGLAVGIDTVSRRRIQIDCGSLQNPDVAFTKGLLRITPSVFVLSHFHLDHYNGLIRSRQQSLMNVPHVTLQEVFFPRIPDFPDREHFIKCMFAMNLRLMGATSGIMEADLISLLLKINNNIPFLYKAVAEGDTINIEGTHLNVLWPPRTIDRTSLKSVKKAIEDFEKALEKDEITKRIYESIGQSGIVDRYLYEGEQQYAESSSVDLSDYPRLHLERQQIPEVVQRANNSLRRAANHNCIVFYEDNRLLFMGDLDNSLIEHVVYELEKKSREYFLVLIMPHHGTHWHRSLLKIRVGCSLGSIGKGLFRKARPEYKMISEKCYLTYLNGDIVFSPFDSWMYNLSFLRGW